MSERGWSDPPFRKLPLGAPGVEVAFRGPSTVITTTPDLTFEVWINGTHYTDPSSDPPEALAIWQRHVEAMTP